MSGVAKQLGAKESVGEIFTGILTRLGCNGGGCGSLHGIGRFRKKTQNWAWLNAA